MAHPYLSVLQSQLDAWQKVKEVSGEDKEARQAEFASLANQAKWWLTAAQGRVEEWKGQEAALREAAKVAELAKKAAEAEANELPDLRELKKELSEARKTLKAVSRPQKGGEEDLGEQIAELNKKIEESMAVLSDEEQARVKEDGGVKDLSRELRKAQRNGEDGKELKKLGRMGSDLKDLVNRLEKMTERQKELTKSAPKGKGGKEIRDGFKDTHGKLGDALKAASEARESYKSSVGKHPLFKASEEAEMKQSVLKDLGKAMKDLERLEKKRGNSPKGETIDPKAAAKSYEKALEALKAGEASYTLYKSSLESLTDPTTIISRADAAKAAGKSEASEIKSLKSLSDKASKKYKSLFGEDLPDSTADGPLLSALYRHSNQEYWTISDEEMDKLAQVISKMFPGGNPLTLLLKSIEVNHKLLIADSLAEHESWAQSVRDGLLESLGLTSDSLPRKATFGKQLQFIIGALAGLVEDPSLQNAVQKAEDLLKMRSSHRRSLENAIEETDQGREEALALQAAQVILKQLFSELDERKKAKEITAAKLKALKAELTAESLLGLASGNDGAAGTSKAILEITDHELVSNLLEELGAGDKADNRSIRQVEKVVSDFKKDYFHLDFDVDWQESEVQADIDAGVRILHLSGKDAGAARKKLEKLLSAEIGKDFARKWNIRFTE